MENCFLIIWWGQLFSYAITTKKFQPLSGNRSRPSILKTIKSMAVIKLSHHGKELPIPILNPTSKFVCQRLKDIARDI